MSRKLILKNSILQSKTHLNADRSLPKNDLQSYKNLKSFNKKQYLVYSNTK